MVAGPSALSRALLRIPVPWVYMLAYLVGVGLQLLLPPLRLTPDAASRWHLTGVVLLACGVIVAGWPLVMFYKAGTTTTPGELSKAFVARGPYRFTRNPMYVGLTLVYLGEMGIQLQYAPIVPLVLVLLYVNGVVIPLEESRLTERFGQTYTDYCGRTRRWF
ncbi:MAG TPA: methyltransferase [Vicinamibacterales bacterium]|jgi:protein-S-isoprenylcysteine O-methyltransferase Ste14|nr:methyltransferase [Vicinamibacterales bacterium]